MSAIMYFKLLTEDAYVQKGNYNLAEFYNPNGDNFLFYNDVAPTDVAFPTTFNREWATITSPEYDWGAYGTGLQVSKATITLPSVTRRTLLYFFDIRGTAERRTLVETPASAANLISQGLISSTGQTIAFTQEEYVQNFSSGGRVDFGGSGVPLLPNGVVVSQVSELYSYNATVAGVNLNASDVAQPIQIYVSPTWLNNDRPLFDQVYFADDNVKFANGTYAINAFQNKPLRYVRWFGGVPSENIAAINREGGSLDFSDSKYSQGLTVSTTTVLTENGVEYVNTDSYNVTNLKRF